MLPVEQPFKTYTGIDGKALNNGSVYFGLQGQDPLTHPVTVYWDAAGTLPVSQPVRTINGYLVNDANAPANVFYDGSYSETVIDSKGREVFYAPTSDDFSIATAVSSSLSTFKLTDYAALRAYTGSQKNAFVTGYLVTSVPSGIAGMFVCDDTDTTSSDNGGTIIVASNGKRWKRQYTGGVSVTWFQTKGDGVTDDTTAINNAITAVYTAGGGFITLPHGRYKVSTIQLRSNVEIVGDVGAYQPDTASGVQFVLTGSGISGVVGTNVIRTGMRNIRIDGSALTGTTNVGLDLNGFWLSHFENVTVFGISPSDGYAIKCRTGTGTPSFGSQHNHFILCETPDGMVRFEGKGPSDQVTTTTVITHRGFQYEVQHCQITFINATAEGWTSGSGFYFYGSGDSVMLHCDIEGTGPVGITVGDTHVLHGSETTIWAGYSGAQRINGQPTTAGTEYQSTVTAGGVFQDFFRQSDNNTTYARGRIRADNIGGGTQEGHVEILRRYFNTDVLQFEWRNQVKVENSKSIANTATTVFTIPVPPGGGVRVKTSARGTQTGAGPFVVSLETVCVNNFGVLAKTDGTALAVQTGGSAGAITYTISGTNLLVQFAHGSASASTVNFVIEIDGDGSGYSKS